jgi:hypothetical protein
MSSLSWANIDSRASINGKVLVELYNITPSGAMGNKKPRKTASGAAVIQLKSLT